MSGETLVSLQRIVVLRLRFDKFLVIHWFACLHFIFAMFCLITAFLYFQSREEELQKLDSLLLEFAKRAAVCG